MRVVNDIKDLIGKTPVLKIEGIEIANEVEIYAKLEYLNPGGSVKDRIGIYMIEGAEREGTLKPGYSIIEPTAGNTGIGIALAAIGKGYRVILVVPDKFSVEKQELMKALGAEIIKTPTEEGMKGAIKKAEELREELQNAVILNQFTNKYNVEAHYRTTGPEIYEQMEGRIDCFVAGVGTGGTYTGVMKYLKERIPGIKGVISDPVGSIIGGGECGCYDIEGIGNSFIPETMDMDLVDKAVKVRDEEAFATVRLLARKTGLTVGSSSGANFAACLKIAEELKPGSRIVTVMPDRSDRYFSKNIYSYYISRGE
jgi:cysteine synthase A